MSQQALGQVSADNETKDLGSAKRLTARILLLCPTPMASPGYAVARLRMVGGPDSSRGTRHQPRARSASSIRIVRRSVPLLRCRARRSKNGAEGRRSV